MDKYGCGNIIIIKNAYYFINIKNIYATHLATCLEDENHRLNFYKKYY